MPESHVPEQSFLYWVLTGCVFGVAAWSAAGIGLLILPFGLALLVQGIKRRPRYGFWPPIFGVVLYASFNVIGFAPPFWRTILLSIVIGIGWALLLRLALRRLGRSRHQFATPPPGEA